MLFSTKSFSQVPCRSCLLFIHSKFTYLETDRAEDISTLDIDAVGDVDALTGGLLLLRSMFGFEVWTLATEAIFLNLHNVMLFVYCEARVFENDQLSYR